MSVLIGTKVKDSALWLARWTRQTEQLEGDWSAAVMYGSSRDASLSILDHWRCTSKHKISLYREPWLPPEERAGAAMLARVEREFQTLLRDGEYEYYLMLDSDLVGLPSDLIPRLIEDDLDLVAPYVWTERRDPRVFFDMYVFRKDKCRFHPYDPPGADADEPLEVDSAGSCYLTKRDVQLAAEISNPYPHIQLGESLREQDYHLYADPRVNVTHVDLERFGIRHPPPAIPLSDAPFLNSLGEKLPSASVQAEWFYTAVDEYQRWINDNRADEQLDVDNWLDRRPLITASYKVLNESRFLKYSLDSIYRYVDRIDIVEGAMRFTSAFANSSGGSTDDTVQIIKEYPDPENKIRLISKRWASREAMQAKLLELCSSRWMLYIDGDEIVEGMPAVRKWCAAHTDGSIVHAKPKKFLHFWHDWRHIVYSLSPFSAWAQYGVPHSWLVWRDTPGLNFVVSHTIPMDYRGRPLHIEDPQYKYFRDRRGSVPGAKVYHFGSAKGDRGMKQKLSIPHPRGFMSTDEPWSTGVMPEDMILERYKGRFPKILRNHPNRKERRIRITGVKPVYTFERIGDE